MSQRITQVTEPGVVGGWGKGWDRTHSAAEPRAVPAAWTDESQLGAGEFCLARSTSEKVPEKKLLLAFVKAILSPSTVCISFS